MDDEGPATTHRSGAFTAATARSAGSRVLSSISDTGTDIMAPSGCSCMAAALAQINLMASPSEKTPDRDAAIYSPTLWPIMPAGWIPQDCHSLANAYSMMNKEG